MVPVLLVKTAYNQHKPLWFLFDEEQAVEGEAARRSRRGREMAGVLLAEAMAALTMTEKKLLTISAHEFGACSPTTDLVANPWTA